MTWSIKASRPTKGRSGRDGSGMKDSFRKITKLLLGGESFAVATVMEKTGSAPREGGAKMIIRADGSTFGSVGGGRMEAETTAAAREAIRMKKSAVIPFRLSGEDAAGSDMICGGSGRILIDFVDADREEDRTVFSAAVDALKRGGAWLVTDLESSRRCLLMQDGSRTGGLDCGPDVLRALQAGTSSRPARPLILGEGRLFAEPLRSRGTAYIFGSGHVAQKIAPLCAGTGFDAVVLDDRSGSLGRDTFPEPIRTVEIASFSELPPLELDGDSYVVIATRGHLHDREVLAGLLRGPAGYIGMMGSRRKKEILFADLRGMGFTEAELSRVHTPIGIPIGAETPEEIAVSVAAELISVRAQKERDAPTP